MNPAPAVSAPEGHDRVLAELEKVLASPQFQNAPFASRFLRYVVENTISGHGDEIKEYRVGADVFDRGDDFDPKVDTIVRVEASRLRKRLADYYREAGAADPIRIEIPKGSYQPVFLKQETPAQPEPVEQAPVQLPEPPPSRLPLYCALAFAMLATGFAVRAMLHADSYCRWRNGLPCEKRIAVLPIRAIEGDHATVALAEGLLYTLSGKLSEIERFQKSLWVVPAHDVSTSSVSSPGQAGRALGVNLVITGSLQKSGDGIRLMINLVDVSQGQRQVQARTLDCKDREPVALHEVAMRAVTEMLDLQLQPEVKVVMAAGGSLQPSAQDYYLQGRGYLEKGPDFADQALGLFTEALRADPNYGLAYAGMASACRMKFLTTREQEWVDKAKEAVEMARRHGGGVAEVNVTAGLIERVSGKLDAAEHEFRKALALDPRNPEAYTQLAGVYEASLRPSQAEATYKKAIGLRPGYWGHYLDLGVFYLRRGRNQEAEKNFHQALLLAPDNTLALGKLSDVYLQTNQIAKAIPLLDRSIALQPSAGAHNNLGEAYYLQARYADMLREMEKAVQLSPAPQPVFNLAIAYRLNGHAAKSRATHERALAAAQKQIEVTTDSAGLRALVALNLAHLDRRAEALEQITTALQAGRENNTVLLRGLIVYEQCGERSKALDILRRLARDQGSLFLIQRHPDLVSLRADAAFSQIVPAARQ